MIMLLQSIHKSMAEYFFIFFYALYFLKTYWNIVLIFMLNFAYIEKWEAEEFDKIYVMCLIHLSTNIPPIKHSSSMALKSLCVSKLQLVPDKLIALHFISWFPSNALYTVLLYVFSFRKTCWGS